MSVRVLYESRQVGWTSVGVGALLDVLLAITGPRADAAQRLETAIGFVIIALIIVTFATLTVRVTNTTLEWHMTLWPMGVRVPIAEIESATPIKTPVSWGIYPTRDGWLWNVTGNNAIAIKLHDGKRYAVGVPEHESVMRAIAKAGKALQR
ncbi:MAG: hypothetical protein ACREJX_09910 [Polyangiaceae bacterium]